MEEDEGEEEAISEGPKPAKDKKGKKDKKKFDPLADQEIKFKKVDFEHALTPEEKAARKKEKEDKKKGKGKHKEPKKAPEGAEGGNEEMGGGDTQEEKSEEQKTDKTAEGEEAEGIEQEPQGKKKGAKKEKSKKETEEKKDKKEKKEKVQAEVPEKGKKKDKEKPAVDKDEKETREEEEEEEIEEEEEKIKKEKEKPVTDTAKKGKEKVKEKEEVPSEKKKGKEKDKGEESKKQKGKKKSAKEAAKSESKVESETVETKEEGSTTGKGKKGKEKKKGKKGKKTVEEINVEEEETVKTETIKKMPSDDEWSWYSCSCSEGAEEEQVEEEEVVTKKGKKGKKDKKAKKDKSKKAKKEEEEEQKKEEEPPPEDDIFAELKKMQAAALGQAEEAAEETTVVKKEKPKKPKKEKKPKEPKKKVVMTEAMRRQMEEEAKRLAEEERIRAEEERKRMIEKEKKEQVDHILRMEQLENSILLRQQIIENNYQLFLIVKEESEWDHFIRCDGLPYPINVGDMNTYIDLWNRYMKKTDIKIATQRTKDVLKILDFLTEYIEMPLDATPEKIEDWKWVRRQCIENQQRNVDSLTCYILSYVKERMRRISIPVAEFNLEQPQFTLCLYTFVALPQPIINPRRPPAKRVEVTFAATKVEVVFPEDLNCYLLSIRSMYLRYDHLTETSRTFSEPEPPDIFKKDLKETTFLEFYHKLYYKYINRIIPPPKPLEEGEEPPPEPEVDIEQGLVPTVPYQKLEPTASEYFVSVEDEMYSETVPSLTTITAPREINLRKFSIIGGIYFLNLFHQPPQPKILPNLEIVVRVLKDPNCLKEYPFYVEYIPPPTPGPGVIRSPEEIEEEMKEQEEKMDKLIFVSIDLPMHVLWLDPPTVCRWNYKEKLWTTEDVHDVKYIEEKYSISFRTGRFGTFGLALNRYVNLPYQTWEIKPERNGTVSLQITAAVLFIEFNVNGKLICISKLQNSPTSAMKEHIGEYYKLTKLMRIMKEGGIDIFPGHDAFFYVEGGHCRKHWPTEEHLYYNVAEIAGCFNVAWSRWNMVSGRRNIIFQLRDYDVEKTKQVPYNLVLVNPLNAIYIDCTEVSPTLNLEPIEGMKFYSDLFFLIRGTSRMNTRTKVQNTPLDMVCALAELLVKTRVFSWA